MPWHRWTRSLRCGLRIWLVRSSDRFLWATPTAATFWRLAARDKSSKKWDTSADGGILLHNTGRLGVIWAVTPGVAGPRTGSLDRRDGFSLGLRRCDCLVRCDCPRQDEWLHTCLGSRFGLGLGLERHAEDDVVTGYIEHCSRTACSTDCHIRNVNGRLQSKGVSQ